MDSQTIKQFKQNQTSDSNVTLILMAQRSIACVLLPKELLSLALQLDRQGHQIYICCRFSALCVLRVNATVKLTLQRDLTCECECF